MLFKRRKSKRKEDMVWATDASRFKGICNEIGEMTSEGHACIVIAHFEDTLQNVMKAMDSEKIQYQRLADRWQMAELDFWNLEEKTTVAFLSNLTLGPRSLTHPTNERRNRSLELHVTVVEHYPIQDRDSAVLSFAETLPPGTTLRFHASLEEPLLRLFGADRTFGLLTSLGWKRTDYMSNSAITEAITSGQSRIKKVSTSDEQVGSQEEWFYYNCPTLRDRAK